MRKIGCAGTSVLAGVRRSCVCTHDDSICTSLNYMGLVKQGFVIRRLHDAAPGHRSGRSGAAQVAQALSRGRLDYNIHGNFGPRVICLVLMEVVVEASDDGIAD